MQRRPPSILLAVALAGCSHGPGAVDSEPDATPSSTHASNDGAPPATSTAPDAQAVAVPDGGSDADRAPQPAEARHYRVVVHTGDSMVGGGLCKALAPKFKAEGTKFVRDVWESASIVAFAEADRVPKLMKKYDPDLVLLTLGANDVFDKHPEYMIKYIETIVKKVAPKAGVRDCYWIGPPLWKGDAGLVDVLRDHVAPCTFYDSSHLTLQRAGDGIHPTEKGGAVWADAFWDVFHADSSPAARDPATLAPVMD
jgi:acyl-CoA thioesterase-1